MIVHLVAREKFTDEYIQYMETVFTDIESSYITVEGEYPLSKGDNITIIRSWDDLIKTKLNTLKQAEKIVVSGVFITSKAILLLEFYGLAHKTYLFFWGGDFYQFASTNNNIKSTIKRIIYYQLFNHSAGLIFLIDGEYEKFKEITHISNRHFVAPMPGYPGKSIDFEKYRANNWQTMNDDKQQRSLRIIVGNSATETNRHIEVFELLSRFQDNVYEVFCPLSYGDERYRDNVIEIGKQMLGNQFHPILDYMDKEDYVEFISKMDVGIFNNDRQQAMGNINMLLNMGKKVYLQVGTSMWNNYIQRGYRVFNIIELKTCSLEEFCSLSKEDWMRNISVYNPQREAERKKACWEAVLNDNPMGTSLGK